MTSPARSKYAVSAKAIRRLCLRLAELDPSMSPDPDAELLGLVSSSLCSPRASVLRLDTGGEILRASFHGFEPEVTPRSVDSPVLRKALELGPLVSDGSDPALMPGSAPAGRYRTSCFAVYPIRRGAATIAILCLSDLQAETAASLIRHAGEMEMLLGMLGYHCQLTQRFGDEAATRDRELGTDELGALMRLVENLEHNLDSRNIFSSFCEIIAGLLPMDAMVVIHDAGGSDSSASIVVQRPLHFNELRREFEVVSGQWHRRHGREVSIEDEKLAMLGRELIRFEGDCPDELRCGRSEVFPVFIDNDLFALVSVCASEESLADRRRLKLFSVLAHHLMLHVRKGQLIVQNQEMQTVDSLTGLYNERQFYSMLEREFDRASRYNKPLCMLIVDVDHFRDVNETYGFETGDMLLKEISAIIMENVRTTDFVSRYSGERFVVVLPETHMKNAELLANRLRRFVENNSFYISNTNVFIKVTVSIGVASYLDHKPANLAQFIEFADTALFFSKRNGRNQVVGYSYVINLMMRDTDNES